MDAINTLRAILAGTAAVAAVLAAVYGLWLTVAVLAVGLAAHGLLWVRQYRDARARSAETPR